MHKCICAESLLLVGGTRSGKSSLALKYASSFGANKLFVATAKVMDAETEQRVKKHKIERGSGWTVQEETLNISEILTDLNKSYSAIVIDCIPFWLFNLQQAGLDSVQIKQKIIALSQAIACTMIPMAIVSAEIGQGIVPVSLSGREFRDLVGETNQILASVCTRVVLVSCGFPLALKNSLPQSLISS